MDNDKGLREKLVERARALRVVAGVPTALVDKFERVVSGGRLDERGQGLIARVFDLADAVRSGSRDPGSTTADWTGIEAELDLELFAAEFEAEIKTGGAQGAASEFEFEWKAEDHGSVVDDFVAETEDMLTRLEHRLLRLEHDQSAEILNEIFRYAHTIKGNSGMLRLSPLQKLSHRMEELLDRIRKGEARVTASAVTALLEALDRMQDILRRVRDDKVFKYDMRSIEDAVMLMEAGLKGEGADHNLSRADTELKAAVAGARHASPLPEANAGAGGSQTAARVVMEEAVLRVGSQRVDRLMSLSGELLIGHSGVRQLVRELQQDLRGQGSGAGGVGVGTGSAGKLQTVVAHLAEGQERLDRVVEELQKAVNRIRMVPLAQAFNRFPRLVRDIAREVGKQVNLVVSGEDVEVDKQIVDSLLDPLLHLVRNAIDHGIEMPDARGRSGKPPEGTIEISALQEGEKILVRVADDGGGIDAERVRSKAIERKLVSAAEAAHLDAAEVMEFLFAPGFSTRDQVSDLSGRGVGMDVVKSAVAALRGAVGIETEVGVGTLVTLSLPVSLGAMEVLMVRSAGRMFAIPLSYVQETRLVSTDEIHRAGRQEVIEVRGKPVPFAPLHRLLGLRSGAEPDTRTFPALITRIGNRYLLVGVEELLGKEKVVMKSMGSLLEKVRGVAGATILGDGQALLILNLQDLMPFISETSQPALQPQVRSGGQGEKGSSGSPSPSMMEGRGGGGPRILVVDDSAVFRRELCDMLRSAGHDTDEAASGDEAVGKIESGRYVAITVDVEMPGMNGYDLTRRIRSLPAHAMTPVIILSTLSQPPDKVRGFQAGADGYLTKPTSVKEIEAALNPLLDRGSKIGGTAP
ncbi:MAG: response regulator [Nitrospirae bacterium]|nr:response regulator [Nitrospirota bacterium]